MKFSTSRLSETLAFAGLFAFAAFLPFGRLSELGVLIALIACTIRLFQQARAFIEELQQGFALVAFGLIFLAALVSCVDALNTKESVVGSFGLLRFLGLIGAAVMLSAQSRTRLGQWILIVLMIWILDAFAQAIIGQGLRGAAAFDRLTGLFGQDNPKLGLVLAALSPIALAYAPSKRIAVALIWPCFAVIILLAGARAGWLMFALVTLAWIIKLVNYQYWRAFKWVCAGCVFAGVCGVGLYSANDRFAVRIDRSAQAFREDGLDTALAGRLPIWQTAERMAKAHAINGVGVRGFRYAYPDFARVGDPWVKPSKDGLQGATHPHQLLLEILSETGIVGLLFWLAALLFAWRAWRASLVDAWPWACALCVLLFPINTHTAMYSSFWAGVLWFLIAMTSAAWASRSLGSDAEQLDPELVEITDAVSSKRQRLRDSNSDCSDAAGVGDGD
jgi:O-antigen ligase